MKEKIKRFFKKIFYWRWWIIPIRIETELILERYMNKLHDEIATNIKMTNLLIERIKILEAKVGALQGAI